MATPALWVNLGSYMWSDNLSDTLRYALQPEVRFRQFADVRDAGLQAKKRGDTFKWDRIEDLSNTASNPWFNSETDNVPEDGFTVTQMSMTVGQIGRAVPFSEKLDDLSKFSVTDIINNVLGNWGKKAFDYAAYAQFALTKLVAVATSTSVITFYTNGAPGAANNAPLSKVFVGAIEDYMSERNIPRRNGDYICIAHKTTLRPLQNDLESVYQYTQPGFQLILNGEIGRYGSVRLVAQNNIPKESTWATNSKSNFAYFLGADTVCEGIVVPEEIRAKIPTNYGLSQGIMLYYLGGFGLVHPDAAQGRIVKWASLS